MTYASVSLKVCEGCGTLWIRKAVTAGVYCSPCIELLQQFPDPKTRLRPGRPPKGVKRMPALPAFPSAVPDHAMPYLFGGAR